MQFVNLELIGFKTGLNEYLNKNNLDINNIENGRKFFIIILFMFLFIKKYPNTIFSRYFIFMFSICKKNEKY